MDRRRFITSGGVVMALFSFDTEAKKKRKRRRKKQRTAPQPSASGPPDYIYETLNGRGPATSESFNLKTGPYLASLDIIGGNFSGDFASVGLYNMFGLVAYLFLEHPGDERHYRYERYFDVPETGPHHIRVSGIDQNWTVAIVSRCTGCPPLPPPLIVPPPSA